MDDIEQPQGHQPSNQELSPSQPQPPKPLLQPEQLQSLAPQLEFFIPPPINYLNSQYYQHLQFLETPLKLFSDKFTNFGQQFLADQSPPSLSPEEPITGQLKKNLRKLNRGIYQSMRKILVRQGRFGNEDKVEGQNQKMKQQMKQFLQICLKAKTFELRSLRIKEIVGQTKKIQERTREISSELQEIKSELRQASGIKKEEFQFQQ